MSIRAISFFLIFVSNIAFANAKELSPLAKNLVFQAIVDHVYAEEGGLVRAPQKMADFQYEYLNPEKVLVRGASFNPLDQKVIGYSCDIEVTGRGIIESIYDFQIIDCQLSL